MKSNIPSQITFIVLTYNHIDFIDEAVQGALSQVGEPIDIIFSDDASKDGTFNQISNLINQYHGHHKITLRRNKINMGINAHINEVMKLVESEFIIIAAGDDISMPLRTERLSAARDPNAYGVFSNAELITEKGDSKGSFVRRGYKGMTDWREMILAGTHGTWGCTLSWDKKVFDVFGAMPENILGEDAVIPFRCALLGGISYVDEELVKYRNHGANVSFWVHEKNMTRAELIQHGIEIMAFKTQTCLNWQVELEIAEKESLISEKEKNWGKDILKENIILFQKIEPLLKTFIGFLPFKLLTVFIILFLRMKRRVDIFTAIKTVSWKLANSLLHYRFPKLHQRIRFTLGKNT